MYQTLQQRRLNWERAMCEKSPERRQAHYPEPGTTKADYAHQPAMCCYCGVHIRYEESGIAANGIGHWMGPPQVTIIEWP